MERFCRGKRKPFPTFVEVLTVAKGLGYRKVVPADVPDPQDYSI